MVNLWCSIPTFTINVNLLSFYIRFTDRSMMINYKSLRSRKNLDFKKYSIGEFKYMMRWMILMTSWSNEFILGIDAYARWEIWIYWVEMWKFSYASMIWSMVIIPQITVQMPNCADNNYATFSDHVYQLHCWWILLVVAAYRTI